MNLYRLKNRIGHYYVIAANTLEAQDLLMAKLNENDFGFFDSRKVTEIYLIAEEAIDSSGRTFFAGGQNLILPPTFKPPTIK